MSEQQNSPGQRELAQAIDELITIDVPGRGFVRKAYQAARAKTEESLIFEAAQGVLGAIGSKKAVPVVIATGATCQRPGLPAEIGEMDGPIGAVGLARFLGRAFSCVPVLATEVGQGRMIEKVAATAGLHALSMEGVAYQADHARYVSAVHILEVSSVEGEAERQAMQFVDQHHPALLVAIEKAGKNGMGVYHNSGGADTSEGKARMEHLFSLAEENGAVTIGIGDGGNEIGMGNIHDELIRLFPNMATCKCGCGGTIASVVRTSHLVIGTVSNWGAYGLVALLSYMLSLPEANHTPWLESRLLEAAAQAGYVNIDGYCLPEVDGLPKEIHLSIVQLLNAMARWPLVSFGRTGAARSVLSF